MATSNNNVLETSSAALRPADTASAEAPFIKVLFSDKEALGSTQKERLSSWDLSNVERIVFPVNKKDFQPFAKQLAEKRVKIDTVFIAGTMSSATNTWKFTETLSSFSHLKKLILTVDMPIEVLSETLRNAASLETFEMPKYLSLGSDFSKFSMLRFCHILSSHSSLRTIKFEPRVEIDLVYDPMGGLVYSPDKLNFSMNAVIKALSKTPNLQVVHVRPIKEIGFDDDQQFAFDVSVLSLAKLCSNPALCELAVDFRSVLDCYGEREENYRLSGGDTDGKELTKAFESSNLTKFSYRHSTVDSLRSEEDEPIILDIVNGLKANCRIQSICIEQRRTQQKPGLVLALAETLTMNATMVELRLPSLRLYGGESLIIKPITDSLKANGALKLLDLSHNGLDMPDFHRLADVLKENDTLETLDLRGNENASTGKNAFKHVLKPDSFASNFSLLHLEMQDYAGDEVGDDDSRAGCDYYTGEFVPQIDLALLLNRAGRGKLFGCTNTSRYNVNLVETISKVPTVCQGNREYYREYYEDFIRNREYYREYYEDFIIECGPYDDDLDESHFPDLECLGDEDDASWLEERDVVRATYEFLRHNPMNWASVAAVSSDPPTAQDQSVSALPEKKMKRTHGSLQK